MKEYNQMATNKLFMLSSDFAINEITKKGDNGDLLLLKSGKDENPVFIKNGDSIYSAVQLLIDNGADVSRSSCTMNFIDKNENETAKLLIKNNADVNFQHMSGNALIVACNNNNVEMVNFLLENNAKVNLQDYQGNSSLHIATYFSKIEIIKILLEQKGDINLQNNEMKNSLNIANYQKNSEVIHLFNQFLSSYNDDSNKISINGDIIDD